MVEGSNNKNTRTTVLFGVLLLVVILALIASVQQPWSSPQAAQTPVPSASPAAAAPVRPNTNWVGPGLAPANNGGPGSGHALGS